MQHFIQGKNIISQDNSGKIKCSDLDILLPLQKVSSNFRQKDSYKEVVSPITQFLSTETIKTLILKSNLLCNSGFLNALADSLKPDCKVISDLEFVVISQNLKDGQYRFIDLSEGDCYKFDFTITNGSISITDKTKLNLDKLKRVLANKFASTQAEALYESITNYNNLIEAIQYLNDYVNEDYADFILSDIALGECFTDTYFSFLFDGVLETLLDFISEHSQKSKTLLLLTPFAAFKPVKEKLNSQGELIAMSVFDLLCQTEAEKNYSKGKEEFEITTYPSKKNAANCISSWMLSESNKLSIELHSNFCNSIEINLNELRTELSSSFFFLQGKEVVKYFLQIERDFCFNLHLKIETLDKKEFYYLINN